MESKKAQLSHATSLGAKRAAVPAQSVRIQAIDTANYIEFTFTYLRRDLLEIRGLVERALASFAWQEVLVFNVRTALPRQPTPEPLPPSVAGPSRTRNTLAGKTVNADAETMQAEIARLRAENATLKGQGTVKRERERDTEGFSSSKRVKTEKIKSEKGSSKKTPIVIDID